MALFEQISKDIVVAMKNKDAVRRDALRNVKKVFLEAKTAPGHGDELTDEEAMKILQKLAKQGREAADIFVQQNRQDLADAELAQVAVYSEYLPKPLTEAELESAVRGIIDSLGVTSIKEMGKVMGVATKQLAGKADGKAIGACVKKILS